MEFIMTIILMRHGQANPYYDAPDHLIPLTDKGKTQATDVIKEFSQEFLQNSVIYCSPHLRCRQTIEEMQKNTLFQGIPVIFDPLLREVAYGGNFKYEEVEKELTSPERLRTGKFYYRFKEGESPADAHTRACIFWQTANKDKNLLIISHGMMVRILVLSYMKWGPGKYDKMQNIKNCGLVKIDNGVVTGIVFE